MTDPQIQKAIAAVVKSARQEILLVNQQVETLDAHLDLIQNLNSNLGSPGSSTNQAAIRVKLRALKVKGLKF